MNTILHYDLLFGITLVAYVEADTVSFVGYHAVSSLMLMSSFMHTNTMFYPPKGTAKAVPDGVHLTRLSI